MYNEENHSSPPPPSFHCRHLILIFTPGCWEQLIPRPQQQGRRTPGKLPPTSQILPTHTVHLSTCTSRVHTTHMGSAVDHRMTQTVGHADHRVIHSQQHDQGQVDICPTITCPYCAFKLKNKRHLKLFRKQQPSSLSLSLTHARARTHTRTHRSDAADVKKASTHAEGLQQSMSGLLSPAVRVSLVVEAEELLQLPRRGSSPKLHGGAAVRRKTAQRKGAPQPKGARGGAKTQARLCKAQLRGDGDWSAHVHHKLACG